MDNMQGTREESLVKTVLLPLVNALTDGYIGFVMVPRFWG
jgi:hypothetical protein